MRSSVSNTLRSKLLTVNETKMVDEKFMTGLASTIEILEAKIRSDPYTYSETEVVNGRLKFNQLSKNIYQKCRIKRKAIEEYNAFTGINYDSKKPTGEEPHREYFAYRKAVDESRLDDLKSLYEYASSLD